MAVNVRINLDFGETADAPERPTVGDVRRWLAAVEAAGVPDDERLEMDRDAGDDVIGFYVWGVPAV